MTLSWKPSEQEPLMNSALHDQLSQIASKTLEDLAFLFATPLEWKEPDDSSDDTWIGAKFQGHCEGQLIFICPTDPGREITINMLGLDDDDDVVETQIQDALKEVVNIICGNILPAMAGTDAVFNISAPEILNPGSGEYLARPEAMVAKAHLDLEGESGYALVFLDDPTALAP
jgi:CheY-specific phosphatase CheX